MKECGCEGVKEGKAVNWSDGVKEGEGVNWSEGVKE